MVNEWKRGRRLYLTLKEGIDRDIEKLERREEGVRREPLITSASGAGKDIAEIGNSPSSIALPYPTVRYSMSNGTVLKRGRVR